MVGTSAVDQRRFLGAGVGGPGAVDAQVGALEIVARIAHHAVRGRAARRRKSLHPVQEVGAVRALEDLQAVFAGRRVQRDGVAIAVHRLPAQPDQAIGHVLRRESLAQRRLERVDAAGAHAARVIDRDDDIRRGLAAGRAGRVLHQAVLGRMCGRGRQQRCRGHQHERAEEG
ncbi:hypothetical protein D3C71_1683460 [compost metagenome]